jgi:hypothetical protein
MKLRFKSILRAARLLGARGQAKSATGPCISRARLPFGQNELIWRLDSGKIRRAGPHIIAHSNLDFFVANEPDNHRQGDLAPGGGFHPDVQVHRSRSIIEAPSRSIDHGITEDELDSPITGKNHRYGVARRVNS